MKKDKKKGNHEPLVSFRRPGSAEQVQFFSVFRSNGGKRESESRTRGRVKKKATKKHLYPYAHQDRKNTKNILRIVNSWGGYD